MQVLRWMLIVAALGLGSLGFGPADALARQSMSFSPGNHARSRVAHIPRHGHAGRARGRASHRARGRSHAAAPHATPGKRYPSNGSDEGDVAKAVPGKGFTLENGILTYPAPARFQPKNLRAR